MFTMSNMRHYSCRSGNGICQVAISHGLSATFENAFRRKLTTDVIGKLLWTGHPVVIGQSDVNRNWQPDCSWKFRSVRACVFRFQPIIEPWDISRPRRKRAEFFSEDDIRPLQAFADFAGVAVHKARLYEENLRLDTVDHDTGLDKYSAFLEKLGISLSRAQEREKMSH